MEYAAGKRRLLVFTRIRAAFFFCICAVIVSVWVSVPNIGSSKAASYQPGGLAVYFLDVGHGDCAVIQLPDGKTAVIDGGEESYYSRLESFLKKRIKTGTVDYVINTHPHSDHCGGLAKLVRNFDVKTVYRPVIKSNGAHEVEETISATEPISVYYDNFVTTAYSCAEAVEFIAAGKVIQGEGWFLTFHTPTEEIVQYSLGDLNEISPIITVESGNRVFVFTGDTGFISENVFRNSSSAGRIFGAGNVTELETYLKVGHHGSNNSSGCYFLNFIKPKVAVVSVGKRYETLPNKDALNRLRSCGADVYVTRDDGDIALVSNGADTEVMLGFDNQTSLALVYAISFPVCFVGCFADIKQRKQRSA